MGIERVPIDQEAVMIFTIIIVVLAVIGLFAVCNGSGP